MKLLIVEEKRAQINSKEFDKIISFCRDDYTNVETYYTYCEYFDRYNEVYNAFRLWLNDNASRPHFLFKEVNLLLAYSKNIFDFLFSLHQKIYLLRKIISQESPTDIFLLKPTTTFDLKYPFLCFFAKDFIPNDVKLHQIDAREADQKPISNPSVLVHVFEFLLNLLRKGIDKFFSQQPKKILLYSDFLKISEVFNYLKNSEAIFLEKKMSKRHSIPLFKKGVSDLLFTDFSTPHNDAIRSQTLSFMSHLENDLSNITIEDIDLTPYLKKYLSDAWSKDLTQTLTEIQQLRTLFAAHPIETVLLDEDRSVSKNLVAQVASSCGSKSFVNCHGDPAHKNGYMPLTANFITVWGQHQKDVLSRWGLEEDRIIVTGSSKYDHCRHISNNTLKGKVFRDLKLEPDLPLILVATCPLKTHRNILDAFFWREIKNIIQTVISSVSHRANIVIKLHPGDDNGLAITKYVNQLEGAHVRVVKNYDALLLTKACQALVVYLSTFSIDGLAYGKPVILGATYDYNRFQHLKYFYDGTDSNKLREALSEILDKKDQRHMQYWPATANYILNGMNGDASRQIADILNSYESN